MYTVVGTSVKNAKKALVDFITSEFSKESGRCGVDKFITKFSKWDKEHNKVLASSIPSYKDIQLACYTVASERKDSDFMPIFDYDEKTKKGIVKSVKYSSDIFAKYYGMNKPKASSFDATKMIIGLLGSEKYVFSTEDIDAIQVALDALK